MTSDERIRLTLETTRPLQVRANAAIHEALYPENPDERVNLLFLKSEYFIRRLGTLLDTTMGETLNLVMEWERSHLAEHPNDCECDNTHEQNNTVCRYCWWLGYRNWGERWGN